MNNKEINRICSCIFRLVVSLMIFIITMCIVQYMYEKVRCLDLSVMPWFVSGTLNFSLGALIVVGTITLGIYLVIWILDGLD